MAEITAATVKELRERTGAGMMDCKKALGETQGEMEAAIDWLRAKGLAAAAKKAGRTAAEGLVGVAVEGNRGAVVEVNSETDFVAKNEQFQDFVRTVAGLALAGSGTVEGLLAAQWPEGGTVEEKLTQNIATIGENQSLRRSAVLRSPTGSSSPTSTTRSSRASARSACWSRSREGRQGGAGDARQAARHAHRRGQPAGADAARSSTRR
jgi:elongation factor Ts